MNKIFVITISKVIALIGFILGFSTKVAAQYGVWEASYRCIGEVKSEICNEAVKGIQVTLEDEKKNVLSKTISSDNGQFSIRYYSYEYDKTLYLRFTDIDGSENGSFLPQTSGLSSFNESKLQIKLAHASPPPCLKEENIDETTNKSRKDLNIEQQHTASTLNLMPVKLPAGESPLTVILLPENSITLSPSELSENSDVPLMPERLQDILIYPNPSKGSFTLSFTSVEKGTTRISVYAATGQVIFQTDVMAIAGPQETKIQLPLIAKGTYILTLSQGKKTYTRNIVIK